MAKGMPELSVQNLAPEVRALLRRHNLLTALVRAEIVAEAVGAVELKQEQCDRLWNGYLSQHNIENDEQLANHLQTCGLDEASNGSWSCRRECSSTARSVSTQGRSPFLAKKSSSIGRFSCCGFAMDSWLASSTYASTAGSKFRRSGGRA